MNEQMDPSVSFCPNQFEFIGDVLQARTRTEIVIVSDPDNPNHEDGYGVMIEFAHYKGDKKYYKPVYAHGIVHGCDFSTWSDVLTLYDGTIHGTFYLNLDRNHLCMCMYHEKGNMFILEVEEPLHSCDSSYY